MTETDDALLLLSTSSIYAFIAAPDSGKSHAVRYLLHRLCQKGLFKDGIMITVRNAMETSRVCSMTVSFGMDGWDHYCTLLFFFLFIVGAIAKTKPHPLVEFRLFFLSLRGLVTSCSYNPFIPRLRALNSSLFCP